MSEEKKSLVKEGDGIGLQSGELAWRSAWRRCWRGAGGRGAVWAEGLAWPWWKRNRPGRSQLFNGLSALRQIGRSCFHDLCPQ
jgi:hypothetical protein